MDRAFQRIRSLMLRGTFYSVPPSRNKLGQVVRLLENAFDQKNFKKAEKGTDYFVAPVYLEMLLYKVKEICS